MVEYDAIVAIFKLVCTIFTIILIGKWIETYCLDEDMTIIENSSYYNDETDVFPVMSLCFKQTFKDKQFETFDRNINGSNYEKFLHGEYFDQNMIDIDYDSVSINISDYIISADISYRNGSSLFDTTSMSPWESPYESYSWKSWNNFLKCFAFELTDENVYDTTIYLNRNIFPDRIRPQAGGFAVMFHYPNQILASIHSITRQWSSRNNRTSNYWMDFNIRGMNVVHRRHKENLNNCISDWKNYNSTVLDLHIESVGCKAPYQKTSRQWPICNKTEKMKEAKFPIEYGYTRPCREIESIDYQTLESEAWTELEDNHVRKLQGKEWDQWFAIVLRYLNSRFVKTISKRKIDIQSLVGYIGGYIGMFTGLALAQIPEMLFSVAGLTKRISNGLCRHLK